MKWISAMKTFVFNINPAVDNQDLIQRKPSQAPNLLKINPWDGGVFHKIICTDVCKSHAKD